jgi:hypothetical protein
MKTLRILALYLVIGLIFSACSAVPISETPVSNTPVSGTPANTPLPQQEGGKDLPQDSAKAAAATAAQKALADHLGKLVTEVTIQASEAVEWPDACLGAADPDEMCAAVITPGFKVELVANGQVYVYHTDQTGKNLRVESSEPAQPDAVEAARLALAGLLKLDTQQIKVVSSEQMEWPDSCLGAAAAGEMCLQVITPGYKVVMQANGQQYIYHTDDTGKSLRLEDSPKPPAGEKEPAGVASGRMAVAAKFGLHLNNVKLVKFEPVDWPNSCLGLAGPHETCLSVMTSGFRVIAEAGGLRYEVHTDAVGKSIRLAPAQAVDGSILFWRRVGGIAGFCDELHISLTGDAQAYSCKGGPLVESGKTKLTEEELTQLKDWASQLAPADIVQDDPATADMMSIRLILSGSGKTVLTQDVQGQMLSFVMRIWQRITGK